MLKQYNNPKCSKLDISAGDLIAPFIDLIYKVYCIRNVIDLQNGLIPSFIDFTEIDPIIVQKYKNIGSSNTEAIAELNGEAKYSLSKWCDKKIYDDKNLSILENREVLFIDKRENLVVYDWGDNKQIKLLETLKKICLTANLIIDLSEWIDTQVWGTLRDTIELLTVNSSDNVASITEEINLKCTFIEKDWLTEGLPEPEIAETKDYWYNSSYAKKINLPCERLDNVAIQRNIDDDIIGYVINNNIIILTVQEPLDLINPNKIANYYWHLFNQSTYKRCHSIKNKKDSLVEKFKDKIKSEKLAYLLSNLQKNLYLDNKCDIPEEYKNLFESCISFDELEHIKNYEFFVKENPEPNKEIFGIYQNLRNRTETHYNLIHWYRSVDENKVERYHPENNKRIKKNKLFVLKPEISFYFREKFFEDFVSTILDDLSIPYISNYAIKYNDNHDAEIDFIVFYGEKLYVIETKTKLTSKYIEKTIENMSRFDNAFSLITTKIEYIILAPYSDDSCERYKAHFHTSRDYNEQRDGLKSKPYRFDVPIGSKKLSCLAEPSYEKLKLTLQDILRG